MNNRTPGIKLIVVIGNTRVEIDMTDKMETVKSIEEQNANVESHSGLELKSWDATAFFVGYLK